MAMAGLKMLKDDSSIGKALSKKKPNILAIFAIYEVLSKVVR